MAYDKTQLKETAMPPLIIKMKSAITETQIIGTSNSYCYTILNNRRDNTDRKNTGIQ